MFLRVPANAEMWRIIGTEFYRGPDAVEDGSAIVWNWQLLFMGESEIAEGGLG